MKTKTYTNNLQKSSGLFLQLGLVLTLFTTYLALELKTEQRVPIVIETSIDSDDTFELFPVKEIQIKRKEKIVAVKQKRQPSTDFVIDDTPTQEDDTPPFVQPIDPEDHNPIDLSGLVDEGSGDNILAPDDHLKIDDVQEIPIFPGCEKVKQSKRRACFEKKMHKHVQRKFNSSLSNQLGLSSGKKRIFVEFLITKTGEIEITNSNAPHSRLEKEGKRVVNKLPTMIPGKQNGEAVNVKYILPIVFNVE
ncbi:MAG: energy transducer TonB [Flavobacteriaceae bacterium]|nr:energy transducer TonB [Flavobacteriaceae bacterium]